MARSLQICSRRQYCEVNRAGNELTKVIFGQYEVTADNEGSNQNGLLRFKVSRVAHHGPLPNLASMSDLNSHNSNNDQ